MKKIQENNGKMYVELPKFTGRNVKISEIAKATGKDPNYIRIGLQQEILKFGTAIKMEGQVNTVISALTKSMGRDRIFSQYRREYRRYICGIA